MITDRVGRAGAGQHAAVVALSYEQLCARLMPGQSALPDQDRADLLELASKLAGNQWRAWTAFHAETLAGGVVRTEAGQIIRLWVRPEHRGLGLGTMLFEAATQDPGWWLRACGHPRLEAMAADRGATLSGDVWTGPEPVVQP